MLVRQNVKNGTRFVEKFLFASKSSMLKCDTYRMCTEYKSEKQWEIVLYIAVVSISKLTQEKR